MEKQDMPPNLELRNSVYYARLGVPQEYQDQFGKKEVWRSLRTKNFNEARQLLPKTLTEIQSLWQPDLQLALADLPSLSHMFQHKQRTLDPQLSAFIAAIVHQANLEEDAMERDASPSLESILASAGVKSCDLNNTVEELANLPEEKLDQLLDEASHAARSASLKRKRFLLETSLRTNDDSLVRDEVNSFIFLFDLIVEPDSSDYTELVNHVLRAKLAAIHQIEQRNIGRWNAASSDPLTDAFMNVHATDPTETIWEAKVSKKSSNITSLYDQYAEDNPRNIRKDTMDQGRKSLMLFLESVDGKANADNFNRNQIREWRNLLKDYPLRANEKKCFRNMTIRQIVEANKIHCKPIVSRRVVNKHLNHVSAFCNWLMVEGHIDANPVDKLRIPEPYIRGHRKPFNIDQLNKIFASPLFTSCESNSKCHSPGTHRVQDHRYWLPILALFTGARLGEIAQLMVSDLVKVGNQWVMQITLDGGNDKSLKNKASERIIPLHEKIVELGFIDYVRTLKAASHDRIFPLLTRNSRGQIAATFSRFWGKYLEHISVKSDASQNFHLFRHTFTDELRRAELTDDRIGLLLGHSKQGMTGRYGLLNEGSIKQRAAMIDAIRYEGLDLSRLKNKCDQPSVETIAA